jgi:GDPmannose 4,6-dehydratase
MPIAFVGEGADEKGIDSKTGKVVIEVSKEFFRPAEVDTLLGDAGKAKQKLGWTSKTAFSELVSCMVDADCKRVSEESSLKHP